MPPKRKPQAAKKNGLGADPAVPNKQRERLLRKILRTTPIPLAYEEAEACGFSPEEIEGVHRAMWG